MCSPVTDGPIVSKGGSTYLIRPPGLSLPICSLMPGQASVMKRLLGRMIHAKRTVLVHLSDRPHVQNPHSSMDPQVGQEYGTDRFH